MISTAKQVGRYHWIPILLFGGFLALRIPFRAEFLVNWDAVNFALGTQFFDLEHHQPHPPGYIGYVALGWLLNHFTGDANSSLTWLSIVSGAAAPAGFFLLASLLLPLRYAVVSAILFGLSPTLWYYSGVALNYSVELAIALFFLWAGYKARQRGSLPYLVVATVLLVLLGAIRQSGGLFLIPLWLYIVWVFVWRDRLLGGAILVGGNLTWLLPLVWLSGGIVPYIRASTGLASLAVMPTAFFAMNPTGISQNFGFVVTGIIVSVNLGLIIIFAGLSSHIDAFSVFWRHRMFFLLWVVPVLFVYLLLHTGQFGYVLLILPAMFLLVGVSLSAIAERHPAATLRTAAAAGGRLLTKRSIVAGIVTLLVLANAGSFLLAPQVVYALMEADNGSNDVADQTRQYNLRLQDAHWNNLIALVKRHDPEETAVLTAPDWAGSFRHFTYYLPDYRVYGLGRDLEGSFGHLFTAYQERSDYAVEGLAKARRVLVLPSGVRWLIVPDHDIYERMHGFETVEFDLGNGTRGIIALVPSGATLVFEDTDEDDALIVLLKDAESDR